jgi:alpha-amylase/alpha-mannosidase (GH57 family)
MLVWHLTPDSPRTPARVSPSDWVTLDIGSWPVEPGQSVWVEVDVAHVDGATAHDRLDARWLHNRGENSYWRVELPPFARGDHVHYRVRGRSATGGVEGPAAEFRVGPKLYLALLWHQHQPLYRDTTLPSPRGSYLQSAVRRHAIRDYYAMAALVGQYPGVHLTINLTPSLLSQIEDYVEHGATDRALELTLIPAEDLSADEREEILRTFFDASYDNQIRPHARYAELYALARSHGELTTQDIRDLQMWFNLAWFAKEFRDGEVRLGTGETISVHGLVAKQRGYTTADLRQMIEAQYSILRAVIPVHRELQERGQIEVSVSPFYHPILPLLIDSDAATLDRPGATLPPRFAYPVDADAQMRLASEDHVRWFGVRARGVWPAEGAVSPSIVPILARYSARWMATDRDVLARSGRWGYDVADPNVLCQPYRVEANGATIATFFRDPWLSNHIGFHCQRRPDYADAARDFLRQIKERFAWRLTGTEDRVLTVVLDGENAWSAYRDDARPFLHALYALLERDREVETVSFSEYLDGNPLRQLAPHPIEQLSRVHELYAGSWADEAGSEPGVDFGTWIGEQEENEAWALLGQVRAHLESSGASPQTSPAAYRAIYAAEGSDWFWWLGIDQESERDRELDALFHAHLRAVYQALGEHAPDRVTPHEQPAVVIWTPTCRVTSIRPDQRLLIRTSEPGWVRWRIDAASESEVALLPVRHTQLDVRHYQRVLGPFPPGTRQLWLRVRTAPAGGRDDGEGMSEADSTITVGIDHIEVNRPCADDAAQGVAPSAARRAAGARTLSGT